MVGTDQLWAAAPAQPPSPDPPSPSLANNLVSQCRLVLSLPLLPYLTLSFPDQEVLQLVSFCFPKPLIPLPLPPLVSSTSFPA